jgi:hypothetical protein
VEQVFANNGRQPLWQETYTYDQGGRKTSRDNTWTVYRYADADWRRSYDRLDRLIQADRGETTGTGFTAANGSKAWTLDELGNWTQQATTGRPTETREHDSTNEIRSIAPAGGTALYRYYDANGNLCRVCTAAGLDVESAPPRVRMIPFEEMSRRYIMAEAESSKRVRKSASGI